jgi:hypothetical protein
MNSPAVIPFPTVRRATVGTATSVAVSASVVDISRLDSINTAGFAAVGRKLAQLPALRDIEAGVAETMRDLRPILKKRFELSPSELDGALLVAEIGVRREIKKIREKMKCPG